MMRRTVYSGDPGLMTSVADSPIRQVTEWINPATETDKTEEFVIQTATLNNILETMNIKNIDFFSLDVEGYEKEVLLGLNLNIFKIKTILLEWHLDISEIQNMLNNTHVIVEQLSKHDYVFVAKE
jgi:FkbM family methyltransferase